MPTLNFCAMMLSLLRVSAAHPSPSPLPPPGRSGAGMTCVSWGRLEATVFGATEDELAVVVARCHPDRVEAILDAGPCLFGLPVGLPPRRRLPAAALLGQAVYHGRGDTARLLLSRGADGHHIMVALAAAAAGDLATLRAAFPLTPPDSAFHAECVGQLVHAAMHSPRPVDTVRVLALCGHPIRFALSAGKRALRARNLQHFGIIQAARAGHFARVGSLADGDADGDTFDESDDILDDSDYSDNDDGDDDGDDTEDDGDVSSVDTEYSFFDFHDYLQNGPSSPKIECAVACAWGNLRAFEATARAIPRGGHKHLTGLLIASGNVATLRRARSHWGLKMPRAAMKYALQGGSAKMLDLVHGEEPRKIPRQIISTLEHATSVGWLLDHGYVPTAADVYHAASKSVGVFAAMALAAAKHGVDWKITRALQRAFCGAPDVARHIIAAHGKPAVAPWEAAVRGGDRECLDVMTRAYGPPRADRVRRLLREEVASAATARNDVLLWLMRLGAHIEWKGLLRLSPHCADAARHALRKDPGLARQCSLDEPPSDWLAALLVRSGHDAGSATVRTRAARHALAMGDEELLRLCGPEVRPDTTRVHARLTRAAAELECPVDWPRAARHAELPEAHIPPGVDIDEPGVPADFEGGWEALYTAHYRRWIAAASQ
jgi:hypothetical protein